MGGYVLLADSAERRATARLEQFALDGRPARVARDLRAARELLPGAGVVVLGEFYGTTAHTYDLLRDIRSGRVLGVNVDLRVVATADGDAQMISAFAAGADLTIGRSASPPLVSASVAALVGRADPRGVEEVMKIGGLTVDLARREVTLHGEPVYMSKKELQVLAVLARHPGHVLGRDEISQEVWGGPNLTKSRALDTHISRMAQKFRSAGGEAVLHNVWGVGYKLTATPEKGVEQ
jgi:DNA-binding response OmpR family regulator